jgi:transcriptional regulator with XRE-family HTH domain
MNIKRSIEMALAQKGLKKKDLAAGLGINQVTLSRILSKNQGTQKMLESSAEYFGMPVSDFIRLGEDV